MYIWHIFMSSRHFFDMCHCDMSKECLDDMNFFFSESYSVENIENIRIRLIFGYSNTLSSRDYFKQTAEVNQVFPTTCRVMG